MSMIGLKLKEWKHAHLKKKSERGGFQRLSWPWRKFRRACALFKILMKQEVEIQKGKSQQKVEQLRRAIAASPRA